MRMVGVTYSQLLDFPPRTLCQIIEAPLRREVFTRDRGDGLSGSC